MAKAGATRLTFQYELLQAAAETLGQGLGQGLGEGQTLVEGGLVEGQGLGGVVARVGAGADRALAFALKVRE